MLAPELIRIQEKPLANWVTPAKVNAIRGEFMRQCDTLDGLADGIINNYMACRAIFDVAQGARGPPSVGGEALPGQRRSESGRHQRQRVPDRRPDLDAGVRLLAATRSRRRSRTATKTFGMWVPNTDPSGSGLIAERAFQGQEGAADDAPMHSHLGVLGVTGFLMKDLARQSARLRRRRRAQRAPRGAVARSSIRRTPTCAAFDEARRQDDRHDRHQRHAGLARRAARLLPGGDRQDGPPTVDRFARLFVMPQTGHGLSGTSYGVDGDGQDDHARADPESLRPDRAAVRLGRERGDGAADVGDGHGGRAQPAALFVSVGTPATEAGPAGSES